MDEILFTSESCIGIIIFCIIGLIICVTALVNDFFIKSICAILFIILILCGYYFSKYLNVERFYK